MKIVVYPHTLELGGSQMNAIDLAAAVRDRGAEVTVFAQPGELQARIESLGLPFVPAPPPSVRPTPRVMRALCDLVRRDRIDVVHGYEWTTVLEAYWGPRLRLGTPVVGTVMSMAVAPFMPFDVPLVVGTRQIGAHEQALGRPAVQVIEPPVDLDSDVRDEATAGAFRRQYGLAPQDFVVVVVCRLVQELKLEGLLAAVDLAGDPDLAMRLVVVGDGDARPVVEARAAEVNARAGRQAVVLTGALGDPRPAYAAADVCLGMGGSALRAMAFGRPLIVQGEQGFWELLTPESAELFDWTGWYGVGDAPADGPRRLRAALVRLRHDALLRQSLGEYSRELAEQRYSLRGAAEKQLAIYRQAASARSRPALRPATTCAARYARHDLDQRWARIRGRYARDDFNARPVAATAAPLRTGVRPPALIEGERS